MVLLLQGAVMLGIVLAVAVGGMSIGRRVGRAKDAPGTPDDASDMPWSEPLA